MGCVLQTVAHSSYGRVNSVGDTARHDALDARNQTTHGSSGSPTVEHDVSGNVQAPPRCWLPAYPHWHASIAGGAILGAVAACTGRYAREADLTGTSVLAQGAYRAPATLEVIVATVNVRFITIPALVRATGWAFCCADRSARTRLARATPHVPNITHACRIAAARRVCAGHACAFLTAVNADAACRYWRHFAGRASIARGTFTGSHTCARYRAGAIQAARWSLACGVAARICVRKHPIE